MKKEQLINGELSKSFYKRHVAIATVLSVFWIIVVWTIQKIDGQRNIYFILAVIIGILLIAIVTSTLIYLKYIRLLHSRFRQIAERLEACASAGIMGIWDWDILSDTLVWDRVMYKLYGIRAEDFGGTYEAWSRTIHPDDKARTKGEINATLRGECEYATEFRVIWPDGSLHYLKAVSHTTFDEHGKPLRMVGVNYDVTEQKQIQQELEKMDYYDRLTNLPNRRLLEDRISQSIARAQRESQKISLLVIDLDKFKPVNDEFGLEVGDWLLQHVAARMQDCLRGSDTASRVGGDDFVILLLDVGSVEYAVKVAEKLRMALNEPFITEDGKYLNISSSIGVAMYPDHAETARDLLRLGDQAMCRAKNGGRNAVKVFTPENILYLCWKATYNCGEPSIDQEHKELFELSNAALDLAMGDDVKPEQIDEALDALITHLTNHFSHEEEILRTRNYEGLNEHSEKHQVLLEEARKLRNQCHEKGIPIGKLVVFFASDVVSGHIQKEDVKFYGLFSDLKQHKS